MSEDLIDFLSLEDNGDTLLQQVTFLNHPDCCHRCKRQGHLMKDCTNEPHFRHDSQSRPNLQQAGTDIEEAPAVLLHPVVPPVGSLHQPQDLSASPFVADPLVRSPAAVTGDTDCPPPVGNTVPISNLPAVSPLIPPNLIPSDSITMEVECFDDDPGRAPLSVTSPSLPDHLRIRTTPWPTDSVPPPNLVTNSLDKEVRI
ncbi:unnamed protein product [Calypogeia fissa]